MSQTQPPTQAPAGTPVATSISVTVGVTKADHGLLIPGAKEAFQKTISEYAEMLFAEAKNIEDMEHAGSGPPEITAPHVEEAKWVLVRRGRRRSAHGNWVAVVRIAQLVATTLVGIGASNLKETWGTLLTVGGVLAASLLFIVERELTRD